MGTLEQDAKRRAEDKTTPAWETAPSRLAQEIIEEIQEGGLDPFGAEFERRLTAMMTLNFLRDLPAVADDAQGAALWDMAVESLGRSAEILEELAESTGEAIARIAARGDRIDRIQKETRALLNAVVASETDA